MRCCALKLASQPGVLDIAGDGLLVRLGLANAGSAGFGGITSGINIGASVTNRAFGGHSRVSVVVNAAMLLAALTVLYPLVAYIPRVALSGVIMVVAVQHIDPWTKQAVGRLMKLTAPRRAAIALDLAVAMLVSVVSIALNVVLAVFIGIALAVFLFVVRMSRSNIRRLYRCDGVRSRKSRDAGQMALLEAKGASILVVELQGALFFGTAERLAHTINAETSTPTSDVILALRRVTEIDFTGARIVADIDAALTRRNIKLLLVRSDEAEAVARLSDVPNLTSRTFPDIDRAIEWAEDDLLEKHAASARAELPLESISILRDFTAGQIGLLASHLERVDWPADHVVFKQGDPGSDLFLMIRGRASVYLTTEAGKVRLVTFAPGAVFGELAILDHGPRSATVTADEPMSAFRLSTKAFADLCELDPLCRNQACLGACARTQRSPAPCQSDHPAAGAVDRESRRFVCKVDVALGSPRPPTSRRAVRGRTVSSRTSIRSGRPHWVVAEPSANARYLRAADGRSRRLAVMRIAAVDVAVGKAREVSPRAQIARADR